MVDDLVTSVNTVAPAADTISHLTSIATAPLKELVTLYVNVVMPPDVFPPVKNIESPCAVIVGIAELSAYLPSKSTVTFPKPCLAAVNIPLPVLKDKEVKIRSFTNYFCSFESVCKIKILLIKYIFFKNFR